MAEPGQDTNKLSMDTIIANRIADEAGQSHYVEQEEPTCPNSTNSQIGKHCLYNE